MDEVAAEVVLVAALTERENLVGGIELGGGAVDADGIAGSVVGEALAGSLPLRVCGEELAFGIVAEIAVTEGAVADAGDAVFVVVDEAEGEEDFALTGDGDVFRTAKIVEEGKSLEAVW